MKCSIWSPKAYWHLIPGDQGNKLINYLLQHVLGYQYIYIDDILSASGSLMPLNIVREENQSRSQSLRFCPSQTTSDTNN